MLGHSECGHSILDLLPLVPAENFYGKLLLRHLYISLSYKKMTTITPNYMEGEFSATFSTSLPRTEHVVVNYVVPTSQRLGWLERKSV